MKRVVVTGMGIVNALGCGIDENWRRILNAECGVREITGFDVSDIPAKIAARVDHSEGAFNPDDWVSPKDQRRMDNFIIYGIAAAQQAVEDSGWQPEDEESQCRTGVLVGSGIGGLSEIAEGSVKVEAGNVRKLSPFFIPASLINLISGHISIRYGFKGPNHAVVTACATGTHAIGDAARMIMLDDADVMIAGGAEAA
ncbi:MAG: beta-ketoacyl-ACP synthase II, partial [Rhodospirillales bacterium]|nr:beta-ketoacyl-ACP synthase II [Rhodospirillales bacterium]